MIYVLTIINEHVNCINHLTNPNDLLNYSDIILSESFDEDHIRYILSRKYTLYKIKNGELVFYMDYYYNSTMIHRHDDKIKLEINRYNNRNKNLKELIN